MTIAVFCILFGAWPVLAAIGGLGFAPLVGLGALATSPTSIRRLKFRWYMIPLAGFLLYATASAFWSPQSTQIIEVNLVAGKLAVKSEVLRVGLLLAASAALIALASGCEDKTRRRVMHVVTVSFFIQIVVVLLMVHYQRELIQLVYGDRPDDEGVQNLSRNALVMGAATPFLVMNLLEDGGGLSRFLFAGTIICVVIALLIGSDMQAGLLAIGLAGACMAVITLSKRWGFRILAGGAAFYIMAAPLLFAPFVAGADARAAVTSADYRRVIWDKVIDIIWQHPFTGSGLGVLRAHRDLIPEGAFAGQLYIPNHAHNMVLQLWAETGAIGAALISAAIVLVAFRLPSPGELKAQAYRVAALMGVMAAVCSVSFDLWNEFWWAVGGLLAVLAMLTPKRGYRAPEAAVHADGGESAPEEGRIARVIRRGRVKD